jgi:hypothetical protein
MATLLAALRSRFAAYVLAAVAAVSTIGTVLARQRRIGRKIERAAHQEEVEAARDAMASVPAAGEREQLGRLRRGGF